MAIELLKALLMFGLILYFYKKNRISMILNPVPRSAGHLCVLFQNQLVVLDPSEQRDRLNGIGLISGIWRIMTNLEPKNDIFEYDKSSPLITIIVAVFNGAKTLQRCIDSVVDQTYTNKELIIMDGESTDSTVDILKANNSKITYWESKSDRGISHAWNKALDHTKGEWFIFLGSDDYFWSKNALSDIVPFLVKAIPIHRIVYGKVFGVAEDGRIIEVLSGPWSPKRFRHGGMYFSHQGIFHHKSLFENYGKFDESYSITADYEFLLRYLYQNDAVYVPDVCIAAMQLGGLCGNDSISISLSYIRAQRNHKVFTFFSPRSWSLVKTIVKRVLYAMIGTHLTRAIIDQYRVLTGRRRRFSKK
jgi:hypothetical protein